MWKNAEITQQTDFGQDLQQEHPYKRKVNIKKKSQVAGVMITQFMEEVPEGKSTPDFTRKPITLTIQEGKFAFFKAIVTGNPKPEVTWKRARRDVMDPEKFHSKYDQNTGEYTLEILKVCGEDADTYKCFAVNEFGRAVCTATLNVIEGNEDFGLYLQDTYFGYRRRRSMAWTDSGLTNDPAEFRKMLRKRVESEKPEKKDGLMDEKFWELLLSSERKDYEHLCAQYGVTDFRWMLKKLNEMKKKSQKDQSQYIDYISNLKHIEVKGDGTASFEFQLALKSPDFRIFLYKDYMRFALDFAVHRNTMDGVMIPCSQDVEMKHNLRQVGKKFIFTIKDLLPEDAGVYQVDVEEVNVFSTELKIPPVDFVVTIKEVKAREREDALFECVLSHPLPKIAWMYRKAVLESGAKYDITVSEDNLIHRLLVKDCLQLDKGIYTAEAGIKSCSAWLLVEDVADTDPSMHGKKKVRKTTQAGGAGVNLETIAHEQQNKLQKDKEENMAAEGQNKVQDRPPCYGGRDENIPVNGSGLISGMTSEFAPKLYNDYGMSTILTSINNTSCSSGSGNNGTKGYGLWSSEFKSAGSRSSELEGSGYENACSDGTGSMSHESKGARLCDSDSEGTASGNHEAKGAKSCGSRSEDTGSGSHECKGARSHDPGSDNATLQSPASEDVKSWEHRYIDTGSLDPANKSAILSGPEYQIHNSENLGSKGTRIQGTTIKNARPWGPRSDVCESVNPGCKCTGLQGSRSGGPEMEGALSSGAAPGGMLAECGSGNSRIENIKLGDAGTLYLRTSTRKETEHLRGESADSHNKNTNGSQELVKDSCRGVAGERSLATEQSEIDGTDGSTEGGKLAESTKCSRKRKGTVHPEAVTDAGVHFTSGLSNVNVATGQTAELVCKLSSDECDGTWYKDGKRLSSTDTVIITKDGALHKLKITTCQECHGGKYRFEADGRKSDAVLTVEDPPRISGDDLDNFSEPIVVKVGQNAAFKMPFMGQDPARVQWYRDGEELLGGTNIELERTSNEGCLFLSKCQRKDSGQIKIRIKNVYGTIEAVSQLIVLDKPTAPQGPVEVVESSASCIEIKWRPPKDNGGAAVMSYVLERKQVGRNTWKRLDEIGAVPWYRDRDVDQGRRYCYRICAVNSEGVSEAMETENIMAGTKAFPRPPDAPKVVSAFKDCINVSWSAPSNTGGSRIVGYRLEKRKRGSSLWCQVNPAEERVLERKYAVRDVVAGTEYEFRVAAINNCGTGEPSTASDFVFAKDPKKRPGRVVDLKVTDSTLTTLYLSWAKPVEEEGVQDEAKGYFVEIRQGESPYWERCNTSPVTVTFFTVKRLKSMGIYWVRVIATNEGGEGEPQELDDYVLAMPPAVKPRFTKTHMKTFMVVKAGNSVRLHISFEASPVPDVLWQKDNVPVSPRVTVSSTSTSSLLLIPTTECSDSGVYTIIVKNLVGKEAHSIEIRVMDDPKPPGPVQVQEHVLGTVTVSWQPSPDERCDDRLSYTVFCRDSSEGSWRTVTDSIFNNKFTACNIVPGFEYRFRVYAKNDTGTSRPSESAAWSTDRKKDKFEIHIPTYKACSLQMAPTFLVPLKMHVIPSGYECCMSCAVGGVPAPCVTWRRGTVSLDADAGYHVTNTYGVCSMLILRAEPGDTGEYTATAENAVGSAESSAWLTVRE